MIICKFGGSSTAKKRGIKNIKLIKEANFGRKIFVFSAIGKSSKHDTKLTDLLIELLNCEAGSSAYFSIRSKIKNKFKKLASDTGKDFDFEKEFSNVERIFFVTKDKNYLISRGEFFTAQILAKFLGLKFVPAEDVVFFKGGEVDEKRTKDTIEKLLKTFGRFVTCGFYGVDENGKIKLFSRGGGDVTGAIISKLTNADLYENWTDVEGIFQINPKISRSQTIKILAFDDFKFMTARDTKVVHADCYKILKNSPTQICVRSTFSPFGKNTLVSHTAKTSAYFVCFKTYKNLSKVWIKKPNCPAVIKICSTKNLKQCIKSIQAEQKLNRF